jgi:hypothetical protein
MFRINPEYIVAGEIVRTSRMYAMSVSPLSYSTLGKISPALLAGLGQAGARQYDSRKPKMRPGLAAEKTGEKEEGQRLKRARDFTNHIKIGSEVFEIETVKGKKQVKLPWEKLKTVMNSINSETAAMYKGLRGIIIVEEKLTLLAGEKLKLILTLAPTLKIDGVKAWSGKTSYNSFSNLDELLPVLPELVKPALLKHGNKHAGKKEMGFVSLFTDGEGNYRTACSRGFHTSLHESLASVETLIDELGDDVDVEKKHIINQTYRRLSDYLG